jgi:hypothetical protein
MSQYEAMNPGVQVSGEAILAFGEGMASFKLMAQRIMEKYGIQNPDPSNWYPQQSYLNAIRDVSDKTGPVAVKSIGRHFLRQSIWPGEVKTIEQAFNTLDVIYHHIHSPGEIGHFQFVESGPHSGVIHSDTPYPCEMEFAFFESVLKHFAPAGSTPVIVHDHCGLCRRNGDLTCTYCVSW